MFAGVAVLVYVAVVLLYASSGRFTAIGDPGQPDPSKVTVIMAPNSVNAAGERMVMQVQVAPPESMVEDQGPILDEDLSVIISPVDGEQTIDLVKGTIPPSTSVSIVAPGEVEQWPFDQYHAKVAVVGMTFQNGERLGLPTEI